MTSRAVVVLVDLVLVVAFAAVGRRNHDEGLTLLGVLDTAWPFLAGAGLGHVAILALRDRVGSPSSWLAGLVVWVCTVAGGMGLRRIAGEGTDPAFVLVATLTLGGLLVGWRVLGWRAQYSSGNRTHKAM